MDILDALKELKKGNKVVSQFGNIYEYTNNVIMLYSGKTGEIPTKSSINTTVVTELLQDDSKFDLYEEPIVLKAGDKYCGSMGTFELVSNKNGTVWGLFNDGHKSGSAINSVETQKMLGYLQFHGYKKVT